MTYKYKIVCDGVLIADNISQILAVVDPQLNIAVNAAGDLTFTMPPRHPGVDLVHLKRSIVECYINDKLVFVGSPVSKTLDFYRQTVVTCEGALGWLADSVQRPKYYNAQTVSAWLSDIVSSHNSQVEAAKRITLGTVQEPSERITCYSNMDSTLKCLREDLIDDLGGFLRIRREGGVTYLDYYRSAAKTNTQTVSLGRNLIDFARNADVLDVATVLIPLGANQKAGTDVANLQTRVTISSVNGGKDYLEAPAAAIANYGRVTRTVKFNTTTTPAALLTKGRNWLAAEQFENLCLDITAFDLSYVQGGCESFELLDSVHVVSAPHGLDAWYTLTEKTIKLNNPEENTITLGTATASDLSDQSSSASGKAGAAQDDADAVKAELKEKADRRWSYLGSFAYGASCNLADVWDKCFEIQVIIKYGDVRIPITIHTVQQEGSNPLTYVGGFYYSNTYNGSFAIKYDYSAKTVGINDSWTSYRNGSTSGAAKENITFAVYYR